METTEGHWYKQIIWKICGSINTTTYYMNMSEYKSWMGKNKLYSTQGANGSEHCDCIARGHIILKNQQQDKRF